MRHRAEQLLAVMRELQVGKSTWTDLQKIRMNWGAWGAYEGACTENHCDYTVSFADVPSGPRVEGLVAYLGHGHLATAFLDVEVKRGIVEQARFQLTVEVPKGHGPRWEREQPMDPGYVPYSSGEYTLIAKAMSRPKLDQLCCYWPEPVPHPNYLLRKPSGCEGCLAIWTEFLPQAEPEVKLRMTTFGFSCITQWRSCADEEDIMPGVGAEYEQEAKESRDRYDRYVRCAYSIDELSQAALNGAVVRVKSTSQEHSNGPTDFRLGLIKQLGGNAVWPLKETVNVEAYRNDPQGKLLSESATLQKPLIVLYPAAPENGSLFLYTCGVLAYSEANEKSVVRGVSLRTGFPE